MPVALRRWVFRVVIVLLMLLMWADVEAPTLVLEEADRGEKRVK